MKSRSLLVYVFIGILGLSSCEKKNLFEQSSPNKNVLIHEGFEGIELSNGLLVFDEISTVVFTLEELERRVNEKEAAFLLMYGNLSEELLNLKEEEIGFDEQKPLKDFEEEYGHASLRQKIHNEVDEWLDNEILDETTDPEDHIIDDIYYRTILNEKSEVKIGVSIYKFLDDGSYYEITDGDFETLNQINEGDDVGNFSNVKHHYHSSAPSECETNQWDRGKKYNSSNTLRIKWKIGMYHYPGQCGMKSVIISYKKNNKKRWSRYRTYLEVGVEGKYCQESAGNLSSSTGWAYHRRSGKKRLTRKITGPCLTKTNQVHGFHRGLGITYYSTLTFW